MASGADKLQHLVEEVSLVLASGGRCVIWVADPAQAAQIDKHLWEFESSSFLPHGIWPCSLRLHPVILSWQPIVLPETSHLIVAHPHECEPSEMFSWQLSYSKILEFVDTGDAHLQVQSRKRFKRWRQHRVSPLHENSVALQESKSQSKQQVAPPQTPEPPSTPKPPSPPRPPSQPSPETPSEPMAEPVYEPYLDERPMEEPPDFLFDDGFPYE